MAKIKVEDGMLVLGDRILVVKKLQIRKVVQGQRFIPENMSEEKLLDATFFSQDKDQMSAFIGMVRARRPKKDNTKLTVRI